ncbi:MAG: YwiC-like family protein [Acidobacteriota bacterium]|jgi:hypothetical protein
MTSLAFDPSRSASLRPPASRWRSVALPAEHGSWGLVGEPVALGLLVAFSPAALLLALGSFAGFLAHRPLKLLYGDLNRGRRYPRTVLAGRFAAGFVTLALTCFAGALALAGPGLLVPLLFAGPLAAVFLVYDLKPGRSWQAELAAPAAFASAAASMALASGRALPAALALWAVMAARSVPTVLYVRERVRFERNGGLRAGAVGQAVAGHLAALGGVALLIRAELLPVLAAVAVGLLAVRTVHGLSRARFGRTARSVGFQEIAWGVVTVLLVAAGFWVGI